MRYATILFGLLLSLNSGLLAQISSNDPYTDRYCSFTGAFLTNIRGFEQFNSEDEARGVMNDIVRVMGLHPNFVIQAANVPNAAAWINQTQRYILYNPTFIQSVRASTHTNWSAISILAHEIGHHLNGHTLTREGSRPSTELEADEFSGFVLRKMGASLDDSQAAMRLLASPQGSSTHPPRQQRLDAIERGWLRADEQLGGSNQASVAQQQRPDSQGQITADAQKPVEAPEEIPMPAYARWRVNLSSNPGSQYFITKSDAFVVVKNGKVYPLGVLKRTADERYPFIIELKNSPHLMVSGEGELLSKEGNNIGKLVRM